MDQQTADLLRERLETERGEVRRQLDDLGARRDAEGIENPDLNEGFADAGQAAAERASLLTLVRSLRDTLHDVERALTRIAHEIVEKNAGLPVALVGIHRWVAGHAPLHVPSLPSAERICVRLADRPADERRTGSHLARMGDLGHSHWVRGGHGDLAGALAAAHPAHPPARRCRRGGFSSAARASATARRPPPPSLRCST